MSNKKQPSSPKAASDKKTTRKAIIGLVIFIAIAAPLIWFVPRWWAEEVMIDYRIAEINGDILTVIFSEKSGSSGRRSISDNQISPESNVTHHYGYFLELYDSAANKSLDKIEFDSLVWDIQTTPALRVFPNGIIWLVSVSTDTFEDKPGFMLKFEIKNNKILQLDFALDEKWRIRDIKDNKVVITDGNTMDGMYYDEVGGCTYFDLETEEIVVLEGWM